MHAIKRESFQKGFNRDLTSDGFVNAFACQERLGRTDVGTVQIAAGHQLGSGISLSYVCRRL